MGKNHISFINLHTGKFSLFDFNVPLGAKRHLAKFAQKTKTVHKEMIELSQANYRTYANIWCKYEIDEMALQGCKLSFDKIEERNRSVSVTKTYTKFNPLYNILRKLNGKNVNLSNVDEFLELELESYPINEMKMAYKALRRYFEMVKMEKILEINSPEENVFLMKMYISGDNIKEYLSISESNFEVIEDSVFSYLLPEVTNHIKKMV